MIAETPEHAATVRPTKPALTPAVEARLTAALGLARLGFRISHVHGVTPDGICRCPLGNGCASAGKHGGTGWLEQATSDPATIRKRFLAPDPGYGVVPPVGSGLLIVDEDVPGALDALGTLPATFTVQTGPKAGGTRGRHLYGRLPAGIEEADLPYRWAGGEVIVAANHQVIGPYCRHRSGLTYEPVGESRVAELPEAWVRALIASGEQRQARERTATGPDDEGWFIAVGRHDFLVARGRHLRGVGLTGERLLDELVRLDRERCRPSLTDVPGRGVAELREIVAWVMSTIDDDPPPITIRGISPQPDADGAVDDVAVSPPVAAPWPEPPDDAAYHGLAGDLVAAVAPATEADPVALLGTILATFGASAGRWRTFYQGSQQAANLFVVLVGDTSAGRKGTAWSIGRAIFDAALPFWHTILVPGLGSGEGLVGYFRREQEQAEEAGRTPEHRALVFESEMGRLLAVMNREGSTLSPTLRDAWDGSPLGRFLAREGFLVPWHHVGLLAHVTATELRAKLADVDGANGYGNRHLWLAVRRSRLVPFPTNPTPLVTPYLEPLRSALLATRTPGELTLSDDAADAWESFYAELAVRPRYGLVGALTARAEAQTARLALVYALLDRSQIIDVAHLQAAIALWSYAERSARFVFGDSTGNRHADALRRELRVARQMTRDGVRLYTGLKTAAELDDVIGLLVSLGLATVVAGATTGRGGRPPTIVRATDAT